ncbi:type II toxin-antitoxin system RelE/ParE family toxin [Treponema sp. R6D11]
MRVFKNTWFHRFANKEGITDSELLEIVDKLEAKQADANLGGDVYKVRVARLGEGKSGGHRVIVYFKSEFRTLFAYGFSKSDRGNVDQGELRAFKIRAKDVFSLTDEQIENRIKNGTLIEIFQGS